MNRQDLDKPSSMMAPSVTLEDIEACIVAEHCFTASQALAALHHSVPGVANPLMLCVIVLHNGFTVIGEGGCAAPENFDPVEASKAARKNAIAKIWPLMGFSLRDQLHNEEADRRLLEMVNEDSVSHELITLDLPEGSLVKVNGLPLELASPARVTTHKDNAPAVLAKDGGGQGESG